MKITTFILMLILLTTLNVAYAHNDFTPKSLQLRTYQDGSTLIEYIIETEPSDVKINVELFGETFHNLIIKDEENNPLDYNENPTGITIDSIGASQITIIYYTFDLTGKEGPLWNLNITSPTDTSIYLPENAAIFDLSDIPLRIKITEDIQFIEFPSGDLYVSYIFSIPDTVGVSETTLETADEYLLSLEDQSYILREARNEYQESLTLFQNDQFSEAKEKALQAQETADNTRNQADSALNEITRTENIINQAINEGKTSGLETAQNTLSTAKDNYNQGKYQEAETYAIQAFQFALSATASTRGNNFINISAFFFLLITAVAYLYTKRGKTIIETSDIQPSNGDKKVDLARIFENHKPLRLEDREVVKYLAKNSGEVFATEIRTRFEMPRSTTWRLIRRLKDIGIVDEIKVGNQSLIRIKEKYHV